MGHDAPGEIGTSPTKLRSIVALPSRRTQCLRTSPSTRRAPVDGHRFDTLAKSVATPATRRATFGALAGAGLFAALGLGRQASAAQGVAPGQPCTLAFATMVRL